LFSIFGVNNSIQLLYQDNQQSAVVLQLSFGRKLLWFIVANCFDTVFISTTGFSSLFGGRQAADLYSATIFNVALIHGGTTSTFISHLSFSEVVADLKLFTCDTTPWFMFVRTHIAIQQFVVVDTSHVSFIQVCI
jgi:hypothetical protein